MQQQQQTYIYIYCSIIFFLACCVAWISVGVDILVHERVNRFAWTANERKRVSAELWGKQCDIIECINCCWAGKKNEKFAVDSILWTTTTWIIVPSRSVFNKRNRNCRTDSSCALPIQSPPHLSSSVRFSISVSRIRASNAFVSTICVCVCLVKMCRYFHLYSRTRTKNSKPLPIGISQFVLMLHAFADAYRGNLVLVRHFSSLANVIFYSVLCIDCFGFA